jgi:hypothetical protein
MPELLADKGDLVEAMVELDEESMVVRNVTPAIVTLSGGGDTGQQRTEPDSVLVDNVADPLEVHIVAVALVFTPRRHSNPPAVEQRQCGRRRCWRPASGGVHRHD